MEVASLTLSIAAATSQPLGTKSDHSVIQDLQSTIKQLMAQLQVLICPCRKSMGFLVIGPKAKSMARAAGVIVALVPGVKLHNVGTIGIRIQQPRSVCRHVHSRSPFHHTGKRWDRQLGGQAKPVTVRIAFSTVLTRTWTHASYFILGLK